MNAKILLICLIIAVFGLVVFTMQKKTDKKQMNTCKKIEKELINKGTKTEKQTLNNDTILLNEKQINKLSIPIQGEEFVEDKYEDFENVGKHHYKPIGNYKIILYAVYRCWDCGDANLGRRHYLYFNDTKIIFDSLLCISKKKKWNLRSHYQEFIFRHAFIFNFNLQEYLVLEGADIPNGDNHSYCYIFTITKPDILKFIGITKNYGLLYGGIGDYNNDKKLDFLDWDGQSDTIKMYSIVNEKLVINKDMFLRIDFTPPGCYPHIIVKESKFPPLDSLLKKS